jgi:thiamine biosynthesis lipoprotein ApbE
LTTSSKDRAPVAQGWRLVWLARALMPISLALLVGLLAYRSFTARSRQEIHDFSGQTMGTTYSVRLAAPQLSQRRYVEIEEAIQARLDRVVELMSTYESESELSRFNRHASTEPFPVSSQTIDVLWWPTL